MTANRPDLLSPQEVRRRAERLFRLDQLQLQGFYGGWIEKAWATRILVHYGREIRESWLLHLSEDDEEGIWPQPGVEFEVLSRAEFHIPPDGPVIIEDRLVPQQSDPAGRVESFVASIVRPDRSERTSFRTALPEEAFWELIGILSGRLDEGPIEQLVDVLRAWDYRSQVGFQDAFDHKLFELDRPENVVTYVDDPDAVDGEASLMYRCEIIAAGRDAFERQLADPRPQYPGVDGASTPEILYVLEEVSPYGMPRKSVPITTGSNPAHWPDAPPIAGSIGASPELPSPSPFSQRVQLETLDMLPASAGVLRGFIAHAIGRDAVREIVGCAMGVTEASARSEVTSLVEARLNGNERLYGEVVLTPQGTGPVRGSPLVELQRRGLDTRDGYTAGFGTSRP